MKTFATRGWRALAVCLIALAVTTPALADAPVTSGDIGELQAQVEQAGAAYDQASAAVARLDEQIASTQQELSSIESQLPELRDQAEKALVATYKMQQNSHGLLEFLFSAKNFNDFIANIQYLNIMQTKNAGAINQLVDSQNALTQKRDQLESDKATLTAQKQDAATALEQAKATRQEAQAKAETQAKEEAAAQPQETPQAQTPTQNVDWSADKTAFVDAWAQRIDAYLAGSPLAGCGRTFAQAAWDFGVDPRFSPAVAAVESSKGAACFAPHNAWGWGSSAWSSWDEAIVAHVSGLARYYGANLSMSVAQKYCPTDASNWYAKTLAEMNSI